MTDNDLLVAEYSGFLELGNIVGYFVQSGANNVGVTSFCQGDQVAALSMPHRHNRYFDQTVLEFEMLRSQVRWSLFRLYCLQSYAAPTGSH